MTNMMRVTFRLYFIIFLQYVRSDMCWVDAENEFKYCHDGCCTINDLGDEGCCENIFKYSWAIAVGVVGLILLVVFFVAIALWCAKKKGQRGRVIVPAESTQVYSSSVTYSQLQYTPVIGHQYQYSGPPPYPNQTPAPYPPPLPSSNMAHNSTTSQPGTSRPSISTQQADPAPEKQPLEQAEGLQAPPPTAYGLPSNHNVV